MRFKATWLLLALAMVAGAYFFFVEQPGHRRLEQDKMVESHLTLLDPTAVHDVRIERPDDTFVFARTGSGWMLSQPVHDFVEDVHVNTLVRAITGADIQRRFTDVADKSAYGLGTPAAIVTLFADDGAVTIAVGDLTLTKTHCFVAIMTDDAMNDEVLMVPAGIRRYAVRTLYEFRDKRVVRLEAEEVTRFTLSSPRETMTWFRTADGPWQSIADHDTIPGDVNEVEAVLRELRGLRASEILSRDAEPTRIGHPSGSVAIESSQQSPIVLTIGQPDENSIYIALDGRDRISRVNASILHLFDKTFADLRDRRLVRFGLSEVATITIETDEGATSFVQSGDHWSFANPTMGTIDQEAVLNFITILQNFRFREISGSGRPGAGNRDVSPASFRLAVYAPDGHMIDEFTASDNRPGNVRDAYSRGLDRWGIIDEEPLADLLARFEGFRVR